MKTRDRVLEDVLVLENVSKEHIMKFLALASKPRILENCSVLGSRMALFFELLKFCRSPEKKFLNTYFFGVCPKNLFQDLFLLFWRLPEKNFEDVFLFYFWESTGA